MRSRGGGRSASSTHVSSGLEGHKKVGYLLDAFEYWVGIRATGRLAPFKMLRVQSSDQPPLPPFPPPSVEDLLSHLGHRMEPFLPALIAITLRLLASATSGITGGGEVLPPLPLVDGGATVVVLPGPPPTAEAIDRSREIRSSSLKLLAQVRGGRDGMSTGMLRPCLCCVLPLISL